MNQPDIWGGGPPWCSMSLILLSWSLFPFFLRFIRRAWTEEGATTF